jgi:hypothetical protein
MICALRSLFQLVGAKLQFITQVLTASLFSACSCHAINQSIALLPPRLRNDVAGLAMNSDKVYKYFVPTSFHTLYLSFFRGNIFHHFWFRMRFSTIALALGASSVFAAPTEPLYTIELAPGETRQVTESEKWLLKAV